MFRTPPPPSSTTRAHIKNDNAKNNRVIAQSEIYVGASIYLREANIRTTTDIQ